MLGELNRPVPVDANTRRCCVMTWVPSLGSFSLSQSAFPLSRNWVTAKPTYSRCPRRTRHHRGDGPGAGDVALWEHTRAFCSIVPRPEGWPAPGKGRCLVGTAPGALGEGVRAGGFSGAAWREQGTGISRQMKHPCLTQLRVCPVCFLEGTEQGLLVPIHFSGFSVDTVTLSALLLLVPMEIYLP